MKTTTNKPLSKEGRRVVSMAKKGVKARQKSRDSKANKSNRSRVSASKKRELMKKTNWKCHVCGRRIVKIENVDIDHVRPRMHGGQDVSGNYLASCKRCNSLRGRLHHSEIKEALAIGKWALQEIQRQTATGLQLADLYGKKWVKQQERMATARQKKKLKRSK